MFGFTCSRNSLIVLHLLHAVACVSLLSVALTPSSIDASFILELDAFGTSVGCVVGLLFLSLVGFIGTAMHHDPLLVAYALSLFLMSILSFGVGCSCLAANGDQQHGWASEVWRKYSMDLRNETQMHFNCCGFENATLPDTDPMKAPSCSSVQFCQENPHVCEDSQNTCWSKLREVIKDALKIAGGIDLFFAFTAAVCICIAVRYKEQKDPKLEPSLLSNEDSTDHSPED